VRHCCIERSAHPISSCRTPRSGLTGLPISDSCGFCEVSGGLVSLRCTARRPSPQCNCAHVDPLECDCAVHVEEVAGQHGRRLGAQELAPGRVGVPDRRREYPQPLENTADRRWLPAVAEFARSSFWVHWYFPAMILSDHAHDQQRTISTAIASWRGGRPTRLG
jgi:hypothetical protein